MAISKSDSSVISSFLCADSEIISPIYSIQEKKMIEIFLLVQLVALKHMETSKDICDKEMIVRINAGKLYTLCAKTCDDLNR